MMNPFTPLAAAINHLLDRETWARDRLIPHAGKVAAFDTGVATLRLKVAPDGLVQTADEEAPVAVTIRIRAADLPLILQHRERAFSYVRIEGDAEFANAISQVGQNLKWEAEEDLSRLVGDAAAVRMVSGTRSAIEGLRATHWKVAENIAEYLLEEQPMLVRPQAVREFADEVAALRDSVERLSKRLDKLERRG